MAEEIEVFQDLNLRGPIARRPELRQALIAAAANPWRFDQERSDEVAQCRRVRGRAAVPAGTER